MESLPQAGSLGMFGLFGHCVDYVIACCWAAYLRLPVGPLIRAHCQVAMPGNARAIKAACALLRDEDAKVRPAVQRCPDLEPLLFVLNSESTWARQLAAQALGQLAARGDPEAVEVLLATLQAPIDRDG